MHLPINPGDRSGLNFGRRAKNTPILENSIDNSNQDTLRRLILLVFLKKALRRLFHFHLDTNPEAEWLRQSLLLRLIIGLPCASRYHLLDTGAKVHQQIDHLPIDSSIFWGHLR